MLSARAAAHKGNPRTRWARQLPNCVMSIVLSRTVMVADRAAPVPFAATRNENGLSPERGMELNTMTHDADDTALHEHEGPMGPSHALSVGLETTKPEKSPPAAGTTLSSPTIT